MSMSSSRELPDLLNSEAPVIAVQDYAARRNALAEALAETEVGGFIAYGDDRQFGGANHIRYLTGFDPHFEPVLLAVRDRRAFLLSGAETLGLETIDVAALSELAYPGLEYTTIECVSGVDLLREFFSGLDSVGLIGAGSIGSDDAAAVIHPLQASFRFCALDEVAYGLRALKSQAEHRVIDHGYAIAAAGMRAAVDALQDGVRERDVATEAEYAMRRAGADGFAIDTMVASGPNSRTILSRSTVRSIRKGEPVTITVAPRYQGYCVSFGRPFVLGAPRDPGFTRAVDAGWRALEAAAGELVPGREGSRATRAARSTISASALETEVEDVWVHSMGVVEFEPPSFGPDSDAVVQPGMAVSIDVPLFHAPWGGMRIEDGYEITASEPRQRLEGSHDAFPCVL
jgi:Xaa-Pro aminopeptidase